MVAGGYGLCQSKVGMLVLRECGKSAIGACGMCNRPVCEAHQVKGPAGLICPECAATLPNPQVQNAAPVTRLRRRQGWHSHYGYYPYYYTDQDYQAFQRDRASFGPKDQSAAPAGKQLGPDDDLAES